jgi:hypothetical protein
MVDLIPKDYSRCNNVECQLKTSCRRWLQLQEDKTPVCVSRFKPENNKCDNQLL